MRYWTHYPALWFWTHLKILDALLPVILNVFDVLIPGFRESRTKTWNGIELLLPARSYRGLLWSYGTTLESVGTSFPCSSCSHQSQAHSKKWSCQITIWKIYAISCSGKRNDFVIKIVSGRRQNSSLCRPVLRWTVGKTKRRFWKSPWRDRRRESNFSIGDCQSRTFAQSGTILTIILDNILDYIKDLNTGNL